MGHTKLGSIAFDHRILEAVRDGKLVVFAGAGVSIGEPSCLPDFPQLVHGVAARSGLDRADQPPDRFLGELNQKGVAVHTLVAERLSSPSSTPNRLHRDLLRLFRSPECVRVVTTNFDLHFESAAVDIFGVTPEVFRAPALPLGDFNGIVHVHGSVSKPRDMVLTDADFGRAYLTEGWARRFLVDVFRQYIVLFVGYSHDDVVMTYLSRALPASDVAGRFALTDLEGNWRALGVTPVRFTKGIGTAAFDELYVGVQKLADRATRGALDWKSRIAELGQREPPTDPEAIDEIDQALREEYTTRFLTEVVREPAWVLWLNGRKHFDALFELPSLSKKDKLLAWWLAEHFAVQCADTLFAVTAQHTLQLNPDFWWAVGRAICSKDKDNVLATPVFRRWMAILFATAPAHVSSHMWLLLAEECGRRDCVDLGLQLFLAMCRHSLTLKLRTERPGDDATDDARRIEPDCALRSDHWSLNKVWAEQLRSRLEQHAKPLLAALVLEFERIHNHLALWNNADSRWDPTCYHRHAIEAHEQDSYPEAIDVLIDAARDSLELLVSTNDPLAPQWIETMASSEAPLLRRLAIHAVGLQTSETSDSRIEWILDRFGLYGFVEHHEVHHALASNYAAASDAVRERVIRAVLDYEASTTTFGNWSTEELTAWSHLEWLCWLLKAKPDCSLAQAALSAIQAKHPDWRPSEHPDFTSWTGVGAWRGTPSPWSAEQLLTWKPAEKLDEIVSYTQPDRFGSGRDGLHDSVRDACMQNFGWGFELADALIIRGEWSSDLWPNVMIGLRSSSIGQDGWSRLIEIVGREELSLKFPHDVAQVLLSLVSGGEDTVTPDLLERANRIGLMLWQALPVNSDDGSVEDWISLAINRSAGVIVQFWLRGLWIRLRHLGEQNTGLPAEYLEWFTLAIEDTTPNGGMARSLLASQLSHLYRADEAWARITLVPWFSGADSARLEQAWSGFLVWGHLSQQVADDLTPAFVQAIPRLAGWPKTRHRRFIEYFVSLAVFYVDDPRKDLLPALFGGASSEDRTSFALQLGYFLRQLAPDTKAHLWENWLSQYWQDRLKGLLAPLSDDEVHAMLAWLPHMDAILPDSVRLAIQCPPVHKDLTMLLYELRNGDLPERFPEPMARLLIYFCRGDVAYAIDDLREISKRLVTLHSDLRRELDEAFARVGA